MKDEWLIRFYKKLIWFGLPAVSLFIFLLASGAKLAIPLFAVFMGIGLAIPALELLVHFSPDFFYSRRWRNKPKPTFSIVRSLKVQREFMQALEELDRMTQKDPQDHDIWLEMLEISLLDMKDYENAKNIHREALTVLEKQKSRDLVDRFYKNITG